MWKTGGYFACLIIFVFVSFTEAQEIVDHGICYSTGESYYCDCNPGFIGPKCCKAVDYCANNLCVHGTCNVSGNGYTCSCRPGWQGQYCDSQVFTDRCAGVTCQNGGTCVNYQFNYKCTCPAGFKGVNCESPAGDLTEGYLVVNTSSNAWGGQASFAVNNIFSNTHASPTYCSHTGSETNPWWSVKMKQVYPVRHIKIYNRTDGGWGVRLTNITAYVDNQVCATFFLSSPYTPIVHLFCPVGMSGQTIKITKNGAILSLCEIEVFGYVGRENMSWAL